MMMVAEKTRKMKEVTEILAIYGLWDIIARIEAQSLGLDKIIIEKRQIAEIEQTSIYERLKILRKPGFTNTRAQQL